jgi:hypothetical protein
MSNVKKRAAEELGGPGERREKEEIRSRACSSSEVLVRLGRTSLRCRFGASMALVRLAAVYRPSDRSSAAAGPLACLRPSEDFARDALFPSFGSRRAAWVRTADASLQCRAEDAVRVPAIGAPSGESATFAAGLHYCPELRHRRNAIATAPQDPEVASLEVCFPVSVFEPRCAGPGRPASGLSRSDVDVFCTGDCTHKSFLAGVRLVLAVFVRAVAPKLPIPGRWFVRRNVFGVAPRVIRARFLQD